MDDRARALAEATIEVPDGETLDDFVADLLAGARPLALNAAFGGETFEPADQVRFGAWPDAVFADRVIMDVWRSPRAGERRGESKLFSLPFTSSTDGFTFGEPVEVERSYSVDFEPVGELSAVEHLRAAIVVESGETPLTALRRIYAGVIREQVEALERGSLDGADALLSEVSGWHPEAGKLGEAISLARRR